jgi:hypothetical protein
VQRHVQTNLVVTFRGAHEAALRLEDHQHVRSVNPIPADEKQQQGWGGLYIRANKIVRAML